MTTLRFRIFLLSLLILASLTGPGYLVYSAYTKLASYRQDLILSYRAREIMETSLNQGFKSRHFQELKSIHESIYQSGLKKNLGNAIAAHKAANASAMRRRLKEFKEMQRLFIGWVEPRIAYLDSRMITYAIFSMTLIFLLTVWLGIYLQTKLLQPIRQLAIKMNDFLHDRYTYQFLLPDNNEMGELQATFNSLAQRVIHNMDELRTLDEAKSEFLSIASHELRTPLTAIKGSLNLLSNQTVAKLDERPLKLVRIAETETDRLIRLINDLLDITRIEAGRLPLRQTWFNLDKTLQTCRQNLEGLLEAAKINLEISNENQLNVQVYMDKDRFIQIVTNLLSNAIKFSPTHGTVTIHYQPDQQGGLLLEVEDQGRGIPPQDQALIFQKFRQSTSPTNPLVKGTGLGLAISKALIEEHGGSIGLRSQPNVGSTFFFIVPEWRDERASKEGAAA